MLLQTLLIASAVVILAQETDDQPFIFPQAGDVFEVGETITLKWTPDETKYPTVSLVLWDPQPDGLFFDVGLDQIKNTGSTNWTIQRFGSAFYHLGLGSGTPAALSNYTESGIFSITALTPEGTTTATSMSSSSSSSTTTTTSATTTTPYVQTLPTGTDNLLPAQLPTFAAVNSLAPAIAQGRNLFGAILLVLLVMLGTILI